MCTGLLKAFTGTVDQPSPSDIFKTLDFMWTEGALYWTDRDWTPSNHYIPAKILRVKKEYVNIPFTKDPILWPSVIPGTFSMDPVFDKEHHNLYMAGSSSAEQIMMIEWLEKEWLQMKRANIVVYESEDHSKYAVHRVHNITYDNNGRLWWFKGDNNATKDKSPARDGGIYWLLTNTTY